MFYKVSYAVGKPNELNVLSLWKKDCKLRFFK